MTHYAPHPVPNMESVYERFRKQHAPNFEGTIDPFEAEEWLRKVEPILTHMNLSNADRISCVSSLLRKDARIWWDLVQQTNDVTTMIWTRFKELFHKKYYTSAFIANNRRICSSVQQISQVCTRVGPNRLYEVDQVRQRT